MGDDMQKIDDESKSRVLPLVEAVYRMTVNVVEGEQGGLKWVDLIRQVDKAWRSIQYNLLHGNEIDIDCLQTAEVFASNAVNLMRSLQDKVTAMKVASDMAVRTCKTEGDWARSLENEVKVGWTTESKSPMNLNQYERNFKDGKYPECYRPCHPFYDICNAADLFSNTPQSKKCCACFELHGFVDSIE
jgi:hypothetical protein